MSTENIIGSEPQALRCVECGIETLDRIDHETLDYTGHDERAVRVVEDGDAYDAFNPLRTRGGRVEIWLTCSSGHQQVLTFGNHKGAEICAMLPVGDRLMRQVDNSRRGTIS